MNILRNRVVILPYKRKRNKYPAKRYGVFFTKVYNDIIIEIKEVNK